MRNTLRSRAAAAALLASIAVLVSGCAYDVYHPGPRYSSTVQYRPAYTYDYHYYPSARVYFHLYSGYYYYRPYNTWLRVRTLPPNIYLGPQERVQVRIWSNKPYLRHQVHSQRYRPHPDFRRDPRHDRYERRYNDRHHQLYMRPYRR
ncbi:MAG TPA: hypothetical protein VK973_10075 [Arenicellales bacterium]|nr:hypothetical protein [Arenicellales bacterium]